METKVFQDTSILYEILLHKEWFTENDNVIQKLVIGRQNSSYWSWNFFNIIFNLFRRSRKLFDSKSLASNSLQWKLAISKDSKVVAILQESVLEIRRAKDDFSIIGKSPFPFDQMPQFRQLSWSPENNMLAIARDSGVVHIYTFLGSNICTIQPDHVEGTFNPVIGLTFLSTKFKTTKWSHELLIVYLDGKVKSVLLSELDPNVFEINITFSFSSHYPNGISCVAYDWLNHLLIVAAPHEKGKVGLSTWRIVNNHPYLTLSVDADANGQKNSEWSRFLFSKIDSKALIATTRLKLSPNGQILGCLQSNGEILFWTWPGLRLIKRWLLHEQPEFDTRPPGFEKNDEKVFYPVDLDWWSDKEVVIVRKCGSLSVCDVTTLKNSLGDKAEFLRGPPQIVALHGTSLKVSSLQRQAIFALECESISYQNSRRISSPGGGGGGGEGDSDVSMQTVDESEEDDERSFLQASIQAALYSMTDMERFQPKMKAAKVVQKTYRLIELKSVTPDELYTRKIDSYEFEDALILAKTYNLDSDLVYQRQWRNNPVSLLTIENYLGKVSKVLWVVNECVQRVPETAQSTRDLIEFGLKLIEKHIKSVSVHNLTSEQERLVTYRLQLLLYLDNLILYEKILKSSKDYNAAEYGELRQLPALDAAVKFARDCKPKAVSVLLTYRPEKTLRHWLPIISNFPETYRPIHYRWILPTVMGENVVPWETETLREPDWVEGETYSHFFEVKNESDDFLYNDSGLREFCSSHLTASLVERWYEARAFQIESLTGLIGNALELIRIAREKYVANLDNLFYDLQTLQDVVLYVDNLNINLKDLRDFDHFEQSKLLMRDANRNNFIIKLKKLIIPFAERCEARHCHKKWTIVEHLLLHCSKDGLEILLEFLRHIKIHSNCNIILNIKDRIRIALDCVYYCLLENQLENYNSILECLPARENNASPEEEELHDRIDLMESHLQICDILEQCQMPKSLKFIAENSDNELVIKSLMDSVASYTRNNSIDFEGLLENLKIFCTVFPTVSDDYCYELVAFSQLLGECEEIVQSAEAYLTTFKNETGKKIPFNMSIDLVLKAARSHFERSADCNDPTLKLAETCLRLIKEPNAEIYDELDLIEAVQLLGDFKVKILLLEVRLCSNRYSLIEKCLTAHEENYKYSQRLVQLAQALRIEGNDRLKREGEVLIMIANHALSVEDYFYCYEICERLINRNYSPSWIVMKKLGECLKFSDCAKKQFLLSFCALHCPRDVLNETLTTRISQRAPLFK